GASRGTGWEDTVVRRAGLWLLTLSLTAALPPIIDGRGTPHDVVAVQIAAARSTNAPALATQLLAPDPADRACAARELGARGVESIAAVPGLIALLADDTIVSSLGCAEDTDSRGHWNGGGSDVIDCPTSPAREASRALARIGTSAVQPLIDALGDVRATMRRYAVIALGLIEDRGAMR